MYTTNDLSKVNRRHEQNCELASILQTTRRPCCEGRAHDACVGESTGAALWLDPVVSVAD